MARVLLQPNGSGQSGDKPLFHKGCLGFVLWSATVILIYFALSIGLTFYQRWFLQKFHYPLVVVMCHLMIKLMVAALFRSLWQCWSRRQRVRVSWSNTIRRIAPMGLFSGLDIAFSNWGLEFITVSLYTMTKSTSIVFILIFALLLKLEQKSWSLFLIVSMISGGLAMFTYKATQFNLLGFLLVLFASVSSGVRWTVAQYVMQRSELGLDHPLDMLYHVQPWMLLSVLPIVAAFEAGSLLHIVSSAVDGGNMGHAFHISASIVGGALIALAMELTEYLIISRMSSLTLSVAGIFKEVCTLVLAVEWQGDEMSRLNAFGLLLCLGGIVCHVVHKAARNRSGGGMSGSGGGASSSGVSASAHFLAGDASTTTDEEDDPRDDDSSTEVLFSVLHSRDR
ncbi:hypothetical protein AAG570_011885 [Ranatra chinensis]|uniref:Sugar phosphate transporter domain-containing protein n=1 Tax=Ranatra chinensis TaxID=642074 RepID=A0ABD0Z3I1_9HEMI